MANNNIRTVSCIHRHIFLLYRRKKNFGKRWNNIKGKIFIYLSILLFIYAFAYQKAISSTESFIKLQNFPKIILWAWERPENLNFIDPQKIGIAFLAKTVYLRKDTFDIKPRFQPLIMPDNAICIAVIRMESDGFDPRKLPDRQLDKVISMIADLCRLKFVHAIQIDFDAKVSERSFYREFLLSLKKEIPPDMPLSITALASWCIYDNWIEDLPLDEAVPMLFRMGIDKSRITLYLKSKRDFVPSISRNSIGLSVDEPFIIKHLDRRIYIFNPQSWTKEALSNFLKEIGR